LNYRSYITQPEIQRKRGDSSIRPYEYIKHKELWRQLITPKFVQEFHPIRSVQILDTLT